MICWVLPFHSGFRRCFDIDSRPFQRLVAQFCGFLKRKSTSPLVPVVRKTIQIRLFRGTALGREVVEKSALEKLARRRFFVWAIFAGMEW